MKTIYTFKSHHLTTLKKTTNSSLDKMNTLDIECLNIHE